LAITSPTSGGCLVGIVRSWTQIMEERAEVTLGWRKLHNEELCDLHSSPSIIRIIKSGRTRWAGHVAHTGEKSNIHRLLVGKLAGRDH
jgi:hypothetical protein